MATKISNPDVYADFVQSRVVVLVHFWGGWNATDVIMKNRLNDLEVIFGGSVAFGSVDVDEEAMWEICRDVGMRNVPALVYYQRGAYIETIIGLKQKEEVEANLNKLLKGEGDKHAC